MGFTLLNWCLIRESSNWINLMAMDYFCIIIATLLWRGILRRESSYRAEYRLAAVSMRDRSRIIDYKEREFCCLRTIFN